jgi:hypothetical protein
MSLSLPFAALLICGLIPLGAIAQDRRCPDLQITRSAISSDVEDLSAAIRAEAGPRARAAEWDEVRACYAEFGLDYFRKIGVVKADPRNKANPRGSQVFVVFDGKRYLRGSGRAYFAAFHEGKLPPGWLAHDEIDGNQISLGSFTYRLPAFYVLEQPSASKLDQAKTDRAATPTAVQTSPATPAPSVVPAASSRRAALVIGNGDYRVANKLPNPANDATDIAAALRKLGFDVVEGKNLDRRGMDDAIRDFGRKLDRADLALFYYAGHGLQVEGKNYLVPVDARLERPGDLALDAVNLHVVLAQMEADTRVNLVFLDACRDNPLTRSLARALGTRSASVGQGLASIQSGIGTMIVYSTQPDNVALDGDGRNSPFTTALLKHISDRGIDIGTIMRRVRADVIAATRRKQVPWDHSSLVGEVVLAR